MAKAKRSLKVNMTDVESGVLVPEGDYIVEVASVEVAESESSGKEYLKWKFEITEGSCKGQNLFHNTSLQPQALFNLKGVLISMGMPVPNNTLSLDLDDIEGRTLGVTVEHEVYEGKKKARVTETFPPDGAESEDDDDTVDPSTLELDELIEFAAENDIDLSSLKAKDKKNKAKVLAVVEAAMAENEDEDDDESEGDSEDVDDDGLDELDLKGLKAYAKKNDIDLSDLSAKDAKNESKVREAIRAAYEDGDNDEEGPDFDEMGLKELKAYAAENDIEIPKKIIKNEEKIRELLAASVEDEDEGVNLDEMDLDGLIAFAKENDIALSKKAKTNEKLARKLIAASLEEDEDEE